MCHIHTSKTNLAGAVKLPKGICFICTYKTTQYAGYTAVVCDKCGAGFDPFEATLPDVVRLQRETLKMSRKQVAEALGYSVKSVRYYENRRCSTPYYNKIKKLIRSKMRGVHVGVLTN